MPSLTVTNKRKTGLVVFILLFIGTFGFVLIDSTAYGQDGQQRYQDCINRRESISPRVSGYISGVYCAYAMSGDDNPLGNPTSEQSALGTSRNGLQYSFQNFEHGRIYLVESENAAFALFNTTLKTYEDAGGPEGDLGLPITSEIGGPPNCRVYFDNGYIRCGASAPTIWGAESRFDPGREFHDLPQMKFPKAGGVTFNSGPHAFGHDIGDDTVFVVRNHGTGIDLDSSDLRDERVAAVMSGTVIGVEEGMFAPGWVAVRSDFSGVVVVHGHIIPDEDLTVGDWVGQGDIIGEIGGGQNHVHLELRDGRRTQSGGLDCDNIARNCWGERLDWSGVIIDGYMISPFTDITNVDSIFNYNGTAVQVSDLDFDASLKYSQQMQQDLLGLERFVWLDCYFTRGEYISQRVQSWWITEDSGTPTPTAANPIPCSGGSYFNGRIVVSNRGVRDLLLTPTPSARVFTEDSFSPIPWLVSSNFERPWNPRPIAPEGGSGEEGTTPENGSGTVCPDDGRDGVYFYANKNYQPPCTFSTVDVPTFSGIIGDNALRSIKIIGNYRVKLYPETQFTGSPGDELNSSEADITWRSHGDSISSARVVNKNLIDQCPANRSQSGIYLYGNANYEPPCYFTTTSIPNLGTTPLGDNGLASIYVKGIYTARFYEHTNYDGMRDEFSGNSLDGRGDPDLSIRSIGNRISSVAIGPQSGVVIDPNSLWSATGNHEFAKCDVGRTYYLDRDYTVTGVEGADNEYVHRWCIKTANVDKARTDQTFMTFELLTDATIYIWFDHRMTTPPDGFAPLFNQNSKQIHTSDDDMKYFAVYSCKSAPGIIKLPGPKYNGGDGAKSMYVVMFGEESPGEGQQLCSAVIPTPTPTYTPAPTFTPTPTFPVTVTPTPTPGDLYEDDNSFDQAWYLGNSQIRQHSIEPAGDQDFSRFYIYENSAVELTVSIDALNSASDARTTLALYDEQKQLVAEVNGTTIESQMVYDCVSPLPAGLYYIKVQSANPSIPIFDYQISQTTMPCSAAHPTTKTMPVWRVLYLIFPSIDVEYNNTNGDKQRLTYTMSSTEMADALDAFNAYVSLVHDFSEAEAIVQPTIVYASRPIASLTQIDTWYWVSPNDVRSELDTYAPSGKYDSVLILWPQTNFVTNQQIPSGGWGLAIGAGNWSNGATYATIANAPTWMWKTPTVGEPWLHEWLHGVSDHYIGRGFALPEGNADGGGSHGYVHSPVTGWAEYYRDLMTGQVLEDGEYKGITALAWQSGTILGNIQEVTADYFYQNTLGHYRKTGNAVWDTVGHYVHLGSATMGHNSIYVPITLEKNIEVSGRVFVPSSGVGWFDSVAVALRGSGAEYWASLLYGTDLIEKNNLSVIKNDGRGSLYPFAVTPGWYTVKVAVDYDTNLMKVKAWADGADEPDWQLLETLDPAWTASEIGFRHYGVGTVVDSLFAFSVADATPTITPTATPTITPTPTSTFTATFTPTSTGTSTPTPTATSTSTHTPTPTFTPTSTSTRTPTPTFTPTATATSPSHAPISVQGVGGSISVGSVITVPVQLRHKNGDNSRIAAISLDIMYDAERLDLQFCEADPGDQFGLGECNLTQKGNIRLSLTSPQGVQGDVLLTNIAFTALLEGSSEVEMFVSALTDESGKTIGATTQSATISVLAQPRGDTSCDGSMNVVDALFILQYDVGLRIPSNQCPLPDNTLLVSGCDVSDDGVCNVVDALFILQCDVGLQNSFCPALRNTQNPQSSIIDLGKEPDTNMISVGSETVFQSQTLRVPISMDFPATLLGAATIELHYDPNVLDAVSCEADPHDVFNSAACNPLFDADNIDTDSIRMNVISTSGITGTHQLAEVAFVVLSAEAQVSELEPIVHVAVTPQGAQLQVQAVSGQVSVAKQDLIFLPSITR